MSSETTDPLEAAVCAEKSIPLSAGNDKLPSEVISIDLLTPAEASLTIILCLPLPD